MYLTCWVYNKMDFMKICKDETLICEENSVPPHMLFPGNFYILKLNGVTVVFRCIGPWATTYIRVNYIVFNGFLTDQTEERIRVQQTVNGKFYKVKNPLLIEIKNRFASPYSIPSLRMIAYNALDYDVQIDYAHASNVHGIYPPISSG